MDQLREYGEDRWEKNLKPKIEAAQVQARKQYDSNLAPQVSKVSALALPYYEAGRENIRQIYETHLLSAYTTCRPYVGKIYAFGHRIAVEIGLPYAQSGWESTVVFIDRTVWPKLRILYGENVEPQLLRIGERLGRYRDGRRLKAAVEDIDR